MITKILRAVGVSDYTPRQAREVNLVEENEQSQENLRMCERSEIAVKVN